MPISRRFFGRWLWLLLILAAPSACARPASDDEAPEVRAEPLDLFGETIEVPTPFSGLRLGMDAEEARAQRPDWLLETLKDKEGRVVWLEARQVDRELAHHCELAYEAEHGVVDELKISFRLDLRESLRHLRERWGEPEVRVDALGEPGPVWRSPERELQVIARGGDGFTELSFERHIPLAQRFGAEQVGDAPSLDVLHTQVRFGEPFGDLSARGWQSAGAWPEDEVIRVSWTSHEWPGAQVFATGRRDKGVERLHLSLEVPMAEGREVLSESWGTPGEEGDAPQDYWSWRSEAGDLLARSPRSEKGRFLLELLPAMSLEAFLGGVETRRFGFEAQGLIGSTRAEVASAHSLALEEDELSGAALLRLPGLPERASTVVVLTFDAEERVNAWTSQLRCGDEASCRALHDSLVEKLGAPTEMGEGGFRFAGDPEVVTTRRGANMGLTVRAAKKAPK